ncbi:MAG TPA: ROK family transcriptional regulator [Chloroflexia bacterium]|nr:ROK family transcriptional regulator [Chloroflexia bacterium]
MRTGNRDLIKQINRSIILNLVRSRGPVSRTDIARLSGLSLATVSGITGELVEQGFAHETGEGESTGGRPPVLLMLNGRAGFVVGLKLTEESIISVLTDLDANVLQSSTTPVTAPQDVEATLATIKAVIEATLVQSGADRAKVMGIGIGMAGLVDSAAGVCRYSPFFHWRDVALAHPIEQHFRLPVFIENDVNALTIAEQWFGAAHGIDHFLVVTVGRGIGLGIVTNGRFYRGASGGAGEFGHITLDENGPRCDCGKRGCLEAIASDPAVVRMVADSAAAGGRPPGQWTFAEVVAAGQRGDPAALAGLQRSGAAIGLGMAHLVNIFNPQMIVLAGEGLRAGDARLAPMRDVMQHHVFNGLAQDVQLIIEPAGDETWARGAACVVLGELFKHPIHRDERASELYTMA